MVKVNILENTKEFLIKEVKYKKPNVTRKFRDKIKIIAYLNENCKRTESEVKDD